jgi:hypothetical protein
MINNNFDSDLSKSNFGISYIHPQGNVVEKFVLAGSDEFLLSEIDVFKKE